MHNFKYISFVLALLLAVTACSSSSDADFETIIIVAAGTVNNSNAFVAVVSGSDSIIAYVCDGVAIAEWFSEKIEDTEFSLSSASSAKLQVSLTATQATGIFTPAGGQTLAFTAAAVNEPYGLWRAEGTVNNSAYLGGWILLPDGEQRGLVRSGNSLLTSPPLAPDAPVNIPGLGDLIPHWTDPEPTP